MKLKIWMFEACSGLVTGSEEGVWEWRHWAGWLGWGQPEPLSLARRHMWQYYLPRHHFVRILTSTIHPFIGIQLELSLKSCEKLMFRYIGSFDPCLWQNIMVKVKECSSGTKHPILVKWRWYFDFGQGHKNELLFKLSWAPFLGALLKFDTRFIFL